MGLGLTSLFKGIVDLVTPVDDRAELTPEIAQKLASRACPNLVFATNLSPREQLSLAEFAIYNGGITMHVLGNGQTIYCDNTIRQTYRVGAQTGDFFAGVGFYGISIPGVKLTDALPRLAGPASSTPMNVVH